MLPSEWLAGFTSKHEAEIHQRTELGQSAECPMQGILCKEHETERERHEPLKETGNLEHDIIKLAIESCDRDLQEALNFIAEELPKVRPDLQPDVLQAGRTLAYRLRHYTTNGVLHVEDPFTRSILPPTTARGEVLIVTEPDLVLSTQQANIGIVVDWKSGWWQRTKQQARDDFQTCVVCWTIWAKYPQWDLIKFIYEETRTNTRAEVWIDKNRIIGGTQEHPLTQEDAFEYRILSAVRLRQSGSREAWPTEQKCAMCDVVKWCPAADYEIAELVADQKLYVDKYIAKEAQLNRMHDAIAARIKAGYVVVGSAGEFNGEPKKKSSLRASFKPLKLEVAKPEKPKPKKKKKVARPSPLP